MENKTKAIERLFEIKDELNELGKEARILIEEHFPSELSHADAYEVFSFGSSSNPYNSTFNKLIEDLEENN